MTIGELFDYVSGNPASILIYSLTIPLATFVISTVADDEAAEKPWNYMLSIMLFLVAVPGVLAVFLNIYLFLFEKQAIMETNIFTQILPILIMIATLLIIQRKADFCDIPGFEKLSAAIIIMGALIVGMWFVDRVRLIAFSFIPVQYLLLLFVVLFLLIRFGFRKLFMDAKSNRTIR